MAHASATLTLTLALALPQVGHSINHHKYNNGPSDVVSTADKPRDKWPCPPAEAPAQD